MLERNQKHAVRRQVTDHEREQDESAGETQVASYRPQVPTHRGAFVKKTGECALWPGAFQRWLGTVRRKRAFLRVGPRRFTLAPIIAAATGDKGNRRAGRDYRCSPRSITSPSSARTTPNRRCSTRPCSACGPPEKTRPGPRRHGRRRLCRPQHQSAPRRAPRRARSFRHRGRGCRDRLRPHAQEVSDGEMAQASVDASLRRRLDARSRRQHVRHLAEEHGEPHLGLSRTGERRKGQSAPHQSRGAAHHAARRHGRILSRRVRTRAVEQAGRRPQSLSDRRPHDAGHHAVGHHRLRGHRHHHRGHGPYRLQGRKRRCAQAGRRAHRRRQSAAGAGAASEPAPRARSCWSCSAAHARSASTRWPTATAS